ncbi:MAG TPA: hypothetical protein VK509_22300 [Polyangiales bacterium]|nr:hypothetical protein [Polyangiales bacterium]
MLALLATFRRVGRVFGFNRFFDRRRRGHRGVERRGVLVRSTERHHKLRGLFRSELLAAPSVEQIRQTLDLQLQPLCAFLHELHMLVARVELLARRVELLARRVELLARRGQRGRELIAFGLQRGDLRQQLGD